MAKNDVVLITGASGFIGGAIIRRLAGQYTLVGLDRAEAKDPPAPAQAIEIDLASDEAVRSALEAVRNRFGNRIARSSIWPPIMTSRASPIPFTTRSRFRAPAGSLTP